MVSNFVNSLIRLLIKMNIMLETDIIGNSRDLFNTNTRCFAHYKQDVILKLLKQIVSRVKINSYNVHRQFRNQCLPSMSVRWQNLLFSINIKTTLLFALKSNLMPRLTTGHSYNREVLSLVR